MNGPKTLNNLTFNNTNGYTINPTNIATDTLTLANGTSNVATLAAAAGSHTINANLVFTSSLVNVSAASGRTLTLNGSITGGGSASISSSGVVVYGGAATYAGITSIASTATLQLGNEVIGTATTNGSASSGVSTLVVASTAGLAATNVVAGRRHSAWNNDSVDHGHHDRKLKRQRRQSFRPRRASPSIQSLRPVPSRARLISRWARSP